MFVVLVVLFCVALILALWTRTHMALHLTLFIYTLVHANLHRDRLFFQLLSKKKTEKNSLLFWCFGVVRFVCVEMKQILRVRAASGMTRIEIPEHASISALFEEVCTCGLVGGNKKNYDNKHLLMLMFVDVC